MTNANTKNKTCKWIGNVCYLPSTIKRMQEKQLTPESMALANRRREVWARLRILKTYHWLKRTRTGYISIREIAKYAKADTRTVKKALKYNMKEVYMQLMEAKEACSSVFNKELYILPENEKNSSLEPIVAANDKVLEIEAKIEEVKRTHPDSTLLRVWQMALISAKEDCTPQGQEYLRKQEEEKAARLEAGRQRDLQRQKMHLCLILRPKEQQAFLQRKKSPGMWDYYARKLRLVFDEVAQRRRKKNGKDNKKLCGESG